jgi:hypothetical protein
MNAPENNLTFPSPDPLHNLISYLFSLPQVFLSAFHFIAGQQLRLTKQFAWNGAFRSLICTFDICVQIEVSVYKGT